MIKSNTSIESILYIDCFAGVAGDMLLSAFFDMGLSVERWLEEMKKIPDLCFQIKTEPVDQHHIHGTHIRIDPMDDDSTHRSFSTIQQMIHQSGLSESVKRDSIAVFTTIAEAESTIHQEPIERIHFHEIGGIDSIVDIVGFCVAKQLLGIQTMVSSPFHLGSGSINTRHGILPVPAPATLAILRGKPVYSTGIEAELTTPTGAAVLSTLCNAHGALPTMKITSIGYGFGTKTLPIPNFVRLIHGYAEHPTIRDFESLQVPSDADTEEIYQLDCNIDDMPGEMLAPILENLLQNSALDAYYTPIIMKKGRPAYLLTVLCDGDHKEILKTMIFMGTTTIGIRETKWNRSLLKRKILTIDTPFGKVDIKCSYLNGNLVQWKPEYESCYQMSQSFHLPLKDVYDHVRLAFLTTYKNLE